MQEKFTEFEILILRLIAAGKSPCDIYDRLKIQSRTLSNYLTRIYALTRDFVRYTGRNNFWALSDFLTSEKGRKYLRAVSQGQAIKREEIEPPEPLTLNKLTPAQLNIFMSLMDTANFGVTAYRLGVSKNTVYGQFAKMQKKLGTHSLPEMIVRYYKTEIQKERSNNARKVFL